MRLAHGDCLALVTHKQEWKDREEDDVPSHENGPVNQNIDLLALVVQDGEERKPTIVASVRVALAVCESISQGDTLLPAPADACGRGTSTLNDTEPRP